MPEVWTIVVAAGSGTRFGGPKQYAELGGRRVLDWSMGRAREASDGVVLVVPPDRVGDAEPSADQVVPGGDTRSASVRAGLAAVPASADVIVVHDAARPRAAAALWARTVDAVLAGADAAVPVVPLVDTVREVDGATVDRSRLVAVQTPQAFRAGPLRAAHASQAEGTDDASLVEAQGGRVDTVEGDPANTKVTAPGDLGDIARARPVIRVGHGFDVHPFATEPRPLVLGGVRFDGERGLHGHSDADALAHACTDALLGAAGLGDIGEHFPDSDPRFAGADSIELLREAASLVRAAGWSPQNVDCTVVLDAPKLAPRRAEVEARLGGAVGAPVSVKAKRPEGLGALGRGEGIAAWAVALVASGSA